MRKAELHPLEQGDILAFMNIGAYSVTEGPALFLSRDMPSIILHGKGGDRLARGAVHSWEPNPRVTFLGLCPKPPPRT